tara:strand:- start:268 stop:567 length:300 start_codon:yes stop_codon:yes gene_type:complete
MNCKLPKNKIKIDKEAQPVSISGLFILLTNINPIAIGFIFVSKINNPDMETGWASLSILILFLGSLQFIAIGIIGEYVGRINIKVNQKPQFVIKESLEK